MRRVIETRVKIAGDPNNHQEDFYISLDIFQPCFLYFHEWIKRKRKAERVRTVAFKNPSSSLKEALPALYKDKALEYNT